MGFPLYHLTTYMECDVCNGQLVVFSGATYQFRECGLDRVYLGNVKLSVCENCGTQSPRIPKLSSIHKTLGLAIALQPAQLLGADIRLLRKQLGYKARDWSELLGIAPATLSRWENGEQTIGTQSDLLIRLLYIRIYEERERRRLPRGLIERISAAANSGAVEPPKVLIDVQKNEHYTYLN